MGTYTTVTMFEIHLANWAPARRVLVDEVSEWYGLFFIAYRCLAGFAVLNVINAVFIQQTMKVASDSHDVKIMQKQKEQESFQKRLRDLFDAMDTSGDKRLSVDEVEQMKDNPESLAWVEWLDIDVSDLEAMFEMFDDGDGELTADEFLAGATRLKGNARNIDMARVLCSVSRIEASLRSLPRVEEHSEEHKDANET